MPRFLLLVSFLLVSCLALTAGNLVAGQASNLGPTVTYKHPGAASPTIGALALKTESKDSSVSTTTSGKKKVSKISSKRAKTKKFAAKKTIKSSKTAYRKSKSSKASAAVKSGSGKKFSYKKASAAKKSPARHKKPYRTPRTGVEASSLQ